MRTSLIMLAVLMACSAKKPVASAPRPANPQPTRPTPPKPVAATSIQWFWGERLMPALEEAQRIQRPVFVAFHAEWCAPCKVMEEEIFTQPTVYSMLNNHFINFKVDFDQEAGRTIADIYEVSKLPTVLFLDTKGVVLERYTGGIGSATLLTNLANTALQKAK